ncbi:hypothetical protein BDV95DRAFT_181242 [Massariosphaeria phaeospora]|uniref:Uncharacterized protein n=1 Tax=Massariosphaeria phaeospora TaxID=100035 RepID=A0A7C8M1X0_9PLEO|nr:hypothetical protein BDV95DRAFT_181242 [Massariosphaeria phaeospora]
MFDQRCTALNLYLQALWYCAAQRSKAHRKTGTLMRVRNRHRHTRVDYIMLIYVRLITSLEVAGLQNKGTRNKKYSTVRGYGPITGDEAVRFETNKGLWRQGSLMKHPCRWQMTPVIGLKTLKGERP